MKTSLLCLLFAFSYTIVLAQKDCRQEDYQQQLIKLYPLISHQYAKVDTFILKHSVHFPKPNTVDTAISHPIPSRIVIPVIVHILWNNPADNISDAQVISQIDVLNKDFSGSNTDRNKIPAYFSSLAAECGISFALARTDPQGHATSGIIRKQTNTTAFSYDDKAKSTVAGGDDAWNAGSYLNIWVCNLTSGISGYASVPGGPAEKDGVVINTSVFGIVKNGPFNLGRTAVHEIGHWLNLRHVWGDANCGDDKVDDTPTQQGPNRGCTTGEKLTCGSTAHGDMYMNFMDFSDDACMYMFTKGQRDRMRALFETGGPRNSLLFSNGLAGDGLPVQGFVPPGFPEVDLVIYPNPAATTLTLQLKDGNSSLGKKVYICNQLGQIVKMMTVASKLQQLDISSLYPGLYFIKLEGVESASAMKKFVKQ